MNMIVLNSKRRKDSHILMKIKEEIIQCEMPKIEQRSYLSLPTKIDNGIHGNVQIYPIKQELGNTSDVKMISDIKQEVDEYRMQPIIETDIKMKDINDIKQEVSEYIIQPKTESELLTSHCDLPTLKIENTDLDNYYLEHWCSSKSLNSTAKVILNKKKRFDCPICHKNFPTSKSRSIHIDGHFKKHYAVCEFCGKLMKKLDFFRHYFVHIVKNMTKITLITEL
ncbi:unnamed protein product [Psylliodes chrysocephalus]|uniref:C2H2-type domain-containing protein n=1 Tax=Psylliodes chrysocephalus TaxID=3402493 RepID=A0A9P0CFQ8_9CUCU|nr:unnamed protein product [Psylliodes chrysocephala]